MAASDRIRYAPVEGADELFSPDFTRYLLALHDACAPRVQGLRAARAEMLDGALRRGRPLAPLPPSEATRDWQVPPVPEELRLPGIEISGPASVTPMFINALNPGPDGTRAEGDLDDDEDSAGHRLQDTLRAALNRWGAVERTLTYTDTARNREYSIREGDIPFFMHRERGLHLDEPDVQVDGAPVPAALLGTALTLFYAGQAQAARGQGVYFYIPKTESPDEVAWYRDVFAASQEHVPGLRDATIRGIILIESLPAVYRMEEMLHALGPFAAGLNAARWDLKASILEYVMADPAQVWPDRYGVDIKTTDFLANMFRRLVAVCHKHGAVAIGGMATALPSADEAVNLAAAKTIREDKEWEARQGFLRGWVAHIYHMKAAADPFKEWLASGQAPSLDTPDDFPVELRAPQGVVTMEGTRRNARTVLEYLEGWLTGRGAKGIDSLEGRPGVHPALMEDLATARIAVAQTAQRIIHRARASDTEEEHDLAGVKGLLQGELADILSRRGDNPAAAERYRKAYKIALRWIKNYTDLDFRSLGSYSRADLDEIAEAPEAW